MSSTKKIDLEAFMQEVHQVAADKGWYEPGYEKTPLEHMALIVSEVAEAMEEIRYSQPRPPIYQIQKDADDGYEHVVTPDRITWMTGCKPDGQAVELADAVIRILDYCASRNLPLIQAMVLKNEYNKTRPIRHGKEL